MKEDRERGLERRKNFMEGEAAYEAFKQSQSYSVLDDDFDDLSKAIEKDDQPLYRAERAKISFRMGNYEAAQKDARAWVKQINKDRKEKKEEKIKDSDTQSLLFSCFLHLGNLQAAGEALRIHFDNNGDTYKNHKIELENWRVNKM